MGKRFSPKCPDWTWGRHNLLASGYQVFFTPRYSGQIVNLTAEPISSAKLVNGAVPLLTLYAFMENAGAALLLYLQVLTKNFM